MQENSPKKASQKRYYSYNGGKLNGSQVEDTQLYKQAEKKGINIHSSHEIEEKGFTFSLSSFQKNQGYRKLSHQTFDTSQKNSPEQSGISQEQNDMENESKRKIVYGKQSFYEKQEEEEETNVTSAKSNNDLFSMIFLNKSNVQNSKKTSSNPGNSPVFSKQKLLSLTPEQLNQQSEIKIKISDFQLGKKLGAGKFGQVYLARHKASGFICALKKLQKSKIDSRLTVQLIRQIKIQTFLNHPNIVKMFTFFSDAQYIYLVMELCFSGQLYGFLKKRRRLPQELTKNILSQVCKALDYMHQNQIIHRDLKPQNIIYQGGLVKICDFGWSISSNTLRGTFCGTPLYVSPELLKRKNYNNKIDIWSIGILTYQLLFGKVPFEIQTEQDFLKIVEDEIKFSKVTKISDEAKDFIINCLQKDPRDRYTVPELLEHVFLAKVEAISMADLY